MESDRRTSHGAAPQRGKSERPHFLGRCFASPRERKGLRGAAPTAGRITRLEADLLSLLLVSKLRSDLRVGARTRSSLGPHYVAPAPGEEAPSSLARFAQVSASEAAGTSRPREVEPRAVESWFHPDHGLSDTAKAIGDSYGEPFSSQGERLLRLVDVSQTGRKG